MINKIVALQGNNLNKLNSLHDTSIFLANEAQNNRYKIFYYEPKNLSIIKNKVVARGFFVKFNYLNKKVFKIIKYKKLNLSSCQFILIRQDPPFNLEYISTTYILDKIKDKVRIINDPTAIRNISEKLYSSIFQKYMPKTIFSKDIHEIKKFFISNKKIIIKPIHSFGGNDIRLIEKSFNNLFVKNFIKKHGHIMCQKFLPKIKSGDKRVFLINGKICGAISRIPKKGSILSNMSKGAKPTLTKLTKKEIYISNLVAHNLKRNNIYFAGIDFIDQKLNGDINVTSPTGLKTYYDLSKINLAKKFWKGLKF
ncbi:glutathione synthase [Candidatus Pelagibacter sp.]|nr:glutathione synthase [Candidatus Pelagibacter sp.]MDA9663264.1 glutathione synthase [Candidatus Pelagibacter sp.]